MAEHRHDVTPPPVTFLGDTDRGEWLLEVSGAECGRVLGIRWDGTYDFGEAPDPGLAGRLFVEAMLPYLAGAGLIPPVTRPYSADDDHLTLSPVIRREAP